MTGTTRGRGSTQPSQAHSLNVRASAQFLGDMLRTHFCYASLWVEVGAREFALNCDVSHRCLDFKSRRRCRIRVSATADLGLKIASGKLLQWLVTLPVKEVSFYSHELKITAQF